jgi:hypothetical protein
MKPSPTSVRRRTASEAPVKTLEMLKNIDHRIEEKRKSYSSQ